MADDNHEVGLDIDRDAIWDANEAFGLLHPFCFADVGEGCYGETVGFNQDPEYMHPHCTGCRGVKWLERQRAAAASSGE